MTKFFTSLLLVLVLFSCKNKFDGKIEKRFGSYFLVNTSPSQGFRYTIKKTEVEDSSVYNYATSFIDLAPGDEKLLGKEIVEKKDDFADTSSTDMSIEIFQPTEKQIEERKKHKKAKAKADKISIFNIENLRNEFDTIVNGRPMMYRYVYKSTSENQTLPVHKFHYSFEITGQVKLKMQ